MLRGDRHEPGRPGQWSAQAAARSPEVLLRRLELHSSAILVAGFEGGDAVLGLGDSGLDLLSHAKCGDPGECGGGNGIDRDANEQTRREATLRFRQSPQSDEHEGGNRNRGEQRSGADETNIRKPQHGLTDQQGADRGTDATTFAIEAR